MSPLHPEAKSSLDELLDGVGQEGIFDMAEARKKFEPIRFHAKKKAEIINAVGALIARMDAEGVDAEDIKDVAQILQSMALLLEDMQA